MTSWMLPDASWARPILSCPGRVIAVPPAMIFLAAVGLTGHDHADESPERVDPGGRSGPGTGVLHRGARLRTAHRHRGVAGGQAGGGGAARVERRAWGTAPGEAQRRGRPA